MYWNQVSCCSGFKECSGLYSPFLKMINITFKIIILAEKRMIPVSRYDAIFNVLILFVFKVKNKNYMLIDPCIYGTKVCIVYFKVVLNKNQFH